MFHSKRCSSSMHLQYTYLFKVLIFKSYQVVGSKESLSMYSVHTQASPPRNIDLLTNVYDLKSRPEEIVLTNNKCVGFQWANLVMISVMCNNFCVSFYTIEFFYNS